MRGYQPIDKRTMPNLMASARGSMDLFTQNLEANTINLKQFRDAADPTQACYQALTNARMEISQFRRGGMLGDLALMQGDPSGGHRILLSRYDSMPIIETLGIEVSSQTQGEGPPVASLTPVFPFWQELDLRYEVGEDICWRGPDQPWRNAEREGTSNPLGETRHEYNNISSAGVQVAIGPFRFPKTTVRLVPLRADAKKQQAIVDKRLNEGVGQDPTDPVRERVGRFTAVGETVYLAVTSFGEMASETNNIGPWADKRVDFAIPVRRDESGEEGDLDPWDIVFGFSIPYENLTAARVKDEELQTKLKSSTLDVSERAKLQK